MTRISTRQRLLAVLLLPFLLVLAGCGKFHADFEIKDVDTIDVAFDIAMDTEFAAGTWSSAEEFCSDMQGETELDENAPTVEPYEADGQYGCTISGVVTSDDFGSELNLTEEDGEFHLTLASEGMSTDVSDIQGSGLDIDFRMTFTFPGEIIEASGGEIDGNSVTYTDLSDVAEGIDIRAEAGGGFPWVIVIVIVVVVGFFLLLLLAAIIFFVVRARKNKQGGSTPAGVPAGYGAAAAGGASPAAPAAPQGQQWGQASPPPPAPQQSPQWGQATPPPPAAPQGEQPWSQPPQQDGQQWGQPPQQGEQPWSQPPQQDGQQWGQPPQQGDQGQQPPRAPGW